MRYLLLMMVVFFVTPVFAQFETRTSSTTATAILRKVSRGEIDFNDIDCKLDGSSLVGDEIFFPLRAKDFSGRLDTTTSFGNMVSDKTSDLEIEIPLVEQHKRAAEALANSSSNRGLIGHFGSKSSSDAPVETVQKTTTQVYKPWVKKYSASDRTEIVTPYRALENKFFKILECSIMDGQNLPGDRCAFTFKLQDPDGEIFTWDAAANTIQTTRAYLKSYMVERKKETVGNFYIANKNWYEVFINQVTGHWYALAEGGRYQCVDIVFMAPRNIEFPSFCNPYFIMKDSVGGQFTISVGSKKQGAQLAAAGLIPEVEFLAKKAAKKHYDDSVRALDEKAAAISQKERVERAKTLEKKFGKATANLILVGEVKIGMSKEACRESWGSPEKKSENSSSMGHFETWYYDNFRHLSFTNGVLKSYSN